MLLGLLPMTAMAATSIPSVSITLDAPAIGASPDYTAEFPSGAQYYSVTNNGDTFRNDIYWGDDTDGTFVYPASSVFQAGHRYKVVIYLTPQEGYTFTRNSTATVNGETAAVSILNGQLEVTYIFPELDPNIASVYVYLSYPVPGEHPDCEASFLNDVPYYSDANNSDGYLNDIRWIDVTEREWMDPLNSEFQVGHSYKVYIYLTPRAGFQFTEGTTAKLNLEEAEAFVTSAGQLRVTFLFPALWEPTISTASITLDPPVPGEHPDYEAEFPDGAPYEHALNDYGYRNYVIWKDLTTSTTVNQDSGVFQAGHQYMVEVNLSATPGYSFTDDTIAMVNGEPESTVIRASWYGDILCVKYTFPTADTMISSVSVALDPPTVGARPDYMLSYPSTDHYYYIDNDDGDYCNGILWTDLTTNTPVNKDSGVFRSGHRYQVEVNLTTSSGYAFTESVLAAINDASAEAVLVTGHRCLKLTYTFPTAGSISSAAVTLDPPVFGEHPDYTAGFPSGAQYYSAADNDGDYRNDIIWIDEISNSPVNKVSGVFQARHRYRVSVFLTAQDGYFFTDDVTATVNGEPATVSVKTSGYIQVTYSFPEMGISSAAVTLDPPLLGGVPDYEAAFPSGAPYYSTPYTSGEYRNGIAWKNETDNQWLDPEYNGLISLFQAGRQYRAFITLTAQEGHAFTAGATATVNGRAATGSISSDGRVFVISYAFPTMDSDVTHAAITLDPPVIGRTPDYTAEFPAGAPYYSDTYDDGGAVINNIYWTDMTTGVNLDPSSGKFLEGHEYRVVLRLDLDDHYTFTESTTATVNGHTADTLMQNDTLRVVYTFPAVTVSTIPSVAVTLDRPTVGQRPDYTAVFPSGAHYYSAANNSGNYINDIQWYDLTTLTTVNKESGVIQSGHRYRVTVLLTAQIGYDFSNSTAATLNGETAETYVEEGQLRVRYSFEAPDTPISSAVVSLDAPAAGAHPDYTAVIYSGDPYYSEPYNEDDFRNDIEWLDVVEGNCLDPDNDVFQAGHVYRVFVYLTPRNGYSFTTSTTATLSGETADASKVGNKLEVTYKFPAVTPDINTVSVTLDPPAAGNRPDYTAEFPAGAHYGSENNNYGYFRNDIEWWDVTDGVWLDPENGVFQAGHVYRVDVYLTERDGFMFTSGTTATLNGQTVTVSDQGYGQILVSYTFPALPSPPTITAQPKNVTVAVGSTATFKVTATGATSYQWYYRKSASGTWTTVSAASGKTSTYSLTTEARHNGYRYRCLVKNAAGSVYTNIVTLTVSSGPVITTQPTNVSVATGSTATFKVTATGATSYQWYYRKSASGTWTAVSAASGKTSTYSLTTEARHNGYQYRCLVKNAAGSVYTNIVTLTVSSKPVITTQPTNVTVAAGKTATFKVAATGATSYQWYYRKSASGTWTAVSASSGKTSTYSLTAEARHNGYQYRCLVKNAAGSVYTNIVTLTVSSEPVITTQPTSKTVTAGSTAQFKVVATGATSYQWYYCKTPTGAWTAVSAASGKTSTYSLTAEARHNGYQYRCLVKNAAGSVYTNIVTLTVNSGPVITTQPTSKTVDAGSTAQFKVVATGATSYQWYYRTSSTGSWTTVAASSGKTSTYSLTAEARHNGYQYRCEVKNTAGSIYSDVATLTVNSKPVITTQPTSKTVTAGSTASFSVAATGATSYQWFYRTSPTGSWTTVAASSGKTSTYSLTVAARHNGYQYRCEVKNAVGAVYTSIVTLTVE